MFTQGAAGVLCQSPDAMRKEAGADGYIWWIIQLCNYALRCYNSRCLYYA